MASKNYSSHSNPHLSGRYSDNRGELRLKHKLINEANSILL